MKTMFIMAALAASMAATAAPVSIERTGLGSGTPSTTLANTGVENVVPVNHAPEVFHTPQYLPYYPTAAVIWPRIIEVPCTKSASGALVCEEYQWAPSMGRGEYLFFTPVVKQASAPVVVKETVVVPGPERIILKEVPVKPKKE